MEVSNSEAACGGVGGGKWGPETTGKKEGKPGRARTKPPFTAFAGL